MYLRYGDPSWETVEPTKGAPHNPRAAAAAASTARPVRHRASPRLGSNGEHLPHIRLSGVRIHAITEAGCIEHILSSLDQGRGGVVVTPNLDHLRRCGRDVSFSAMVSEADLVVADGMPLIWASRLQATPLPERVAGSDLISSLSSAAAEQNRSVFLLGGTPGTAEAAAKVLQQRYPRIRIAGCHCPPMGFEENATAMAAIVAAVTSVQPDIVYVALGSPKQENLINAIRRHLPSAWWLGVGNSFSFLSGNVRRAPMWMQRWGLEWAHRLLQEPRRLFKRYIVYGVPFATRLFAKALVRGIPNRIWRPEPPESVVRSAGAGGNGNVIDAIRHMDSAAPSLLVPNNGNGHAHGNGNGHAVPEEALLAEDAAPAAARKIDLTIASTKAGATPRTLNRLKGVILLGGSMRPTPLTSSIGRSVLDLPLDESGTILNNWLNHSAELARMAGLDKLPVRIMVDQNAPEPTSADPRHFGTFGVERDHSEYRGTGGVLGDLCGDYEDDDLILMANAAQVLLDPLAGIAAALDRTPGAISLISHDDGTPSGIMLITCKTLRLIPRAGFVDMKEQALPTIASRYDVSVVNRRKPTGLPIRSLADYILALRMHHRRKAGKRLVTDPLGEDWRPSFTLVEPGAAVDPRAHLHDSVVLRGATVEAGGILVRSIVCPGGIVRRDRTAVDQFVTKARVGGVNQP